MKKLKKTFLFLLALLGVVSANAISMPKFATSAEDATWYYICFPQGEHYLSDRGNNTKMRAVAFNSTNAGNKWTLIGTKDNFKLMSQNNRYVYFPGTSVEYVASTTEATSFRLIRNEADDDYWELQRTDKENTSLARTKLTASSTVRDSISGTSFSAVRFDAIDNLTPDFSNSGNDTWYFLQFRHGAQTVIADKGNNTNVAQADMTRSDNVLWKLVGDKESFKIIGKSGRYLYYNTSTQRIAATATASQAGTFRLVQTENSTYSPGWMIEESEHSGYYFNAWGGVTAGNTVGLWNSASDSNNPIAFINEADFEALEYTVNSLSSYTPEHTSTLWYNVPAVLGKKLCGDVWKDYALPLGNGQLGSTFIGGVYKEDLQFNEKTLWTGRSTDNSTSGSKYSAGNGGYGGYQNFGDIIVKNIDTETFDFDASKKATDYLRTLDLSTATGSVTFKNADKSVSYERKYIVSNPDNVGVYMFTANKPGKQSLRINLVSGKPGVDATSKYEEGEAYFSGKLETVSYNARIKVVNKGGTLRTRITSIEVLNADTVLIYMAAGTDYDIYSNSYTNATLRSNLASTMQERITKAAQKSWEQIYEDHVADHQQYFNRVDFQIDAAKNNQPTNQLVDNYTTYKGTTNAGALMLEKLYFDYGRYLTIAGSRGIDLPTNLQGIWNNNSSAPWGADIHANINVQMNYWPAEPTNLSELHLPFLNYIIRMAETKEWKQNARSLAGQSVGWTCITENNIFGGRGNFQENYVIANAWYVTHLWQHYRYTLDRDFLKKAFPAMWGATQFWMERLVKASDETYECPNEYSPEHGPSRENAVAHAQQLVAELFCNTLDAIEVLGSDANISEENINKLKERYQNLDKGLAIEEYTGRWGNTVNGISSGTKILREWKYSDYTAGANGHRHASHLMCLYPFSQVEQGTDLFNAAVNSLQLRGDNSTGWSMAWKVNMWARAKNGAHAHQIFDYALIPGSGSGGVFYNLFDVHAPYYFQIDGNFGACSGMAEMLLQSHTGTLEILPALPTQLWRSGHIKGLKAVGDFTVDITWKNGAADYVRIVSNQGQPLRVKMKNVANANYFYINGQIITPTQITTDLVELNAQAGDEIYIFMNSVPVGFKTATLASARPKVSIISRTISVSGDVQSVEITDLQGRMLKRTHKNSIKAPQNWGNLMLVKVTDSKGNISVQKIGL